MDLPSQHSSSHGTTYALWHIPSSTLLVSSDYRDEIARHLRGALDEGCSVGEFMLQITDSGALIGHQVLGDQIMDAIAGNDGRAEIALGPA